MDTKRAQELLTIFKDGVSHEPGKGLELVLEYQDVIGHSSMQEIRDFETGLESQEGKKHFIWVNFLTLSHDMAVDILRKTVVARLIEKEADTMEKQWETEWDKHHKAAVILEEAKRAIFRRIRKAEQENARLSKKVESLEIQRVGYISQTKAFRDEAWRNKEKADKYDKLVELLKG